MEQIEFKEIDLFLNMIGGHNYILKIGGGKLIKAVEKSEIEFYENFSSLTVGQQEIFNNQLTNIEEGKINSCTEDKNCKNKFYLNENSVKSNLQTQIKEIQQINLFPKYFGYWNKISNPDVFNIIEKFTKFVDNIFYEFILNLQQENPEFLENLNYSCVSQDQAKNSSEFKEKLKLFFAEKNIFKENNENVKNSIIVFENSDNKYKDVEFRFNLKSLRNLNEKKLKWIVFWYIKKRKNLIKDNFVILEDLTYNMNLPAILDIKIGLIKKISKKDYNLKIIPESSLELGFRIMGQQVNAK
jgi:hypothetical protein